MLIYKTSLSSEQRPDNSNSQLNRITLSALADRAADGAEALGGSAGGWRRVGGAQTEERLSENRR